ncbi:putative leucine-rich repeat-containing protein DDB_G0290503 isoform X2 [Calliphora vicina]|uniref:putative leucine-rich repeat-containing protein DDB_G0290503 isoform X2 n=1 Tax=Calliphora vicina TaxID=7373 RepID=UPI00325B813B
MDNSVIPLPEINKGSLEVAKDNVDNSSARSSVKSCKTTVGSEASSKSIPKLVNTKAASKSLISLNKNENLNKTSIAQARKTTSPNSLKPPVKSKIPAMKRSPSSTSNINNKTTVPQKPQGRTPLCQKIPQLKLSTEKQSLNMIRSSKSKSSISRSVSPKIEEIPGSISKSSFLTSGTTLKQAEMIAKSQSARSKSESPGSGASKRSASNISTRSTPCARRKGEKETNLRKMLSTAGDHKQIDRLESNTKPEQIGRQQITENLKEISTEEIKSPDIVNDFKDKLKTHMDQWFSSFKDELNNTKEANAVDLENMEQLQILQSNGILSLIDDWCASTVEGCDSKIVNLQKMLEESNKCLRDSEQKCNELTKRLDEESIKWEKELAEKAAADHEEIKELQNKLKTQDKLNKSSIQNMEKEKNNLLAEKNRLHEDLNTCKERIANANTKLQASEQQLSQFKKDLKSKVEIIKKFESDLEDKKKLETNLTEVTNKLEELQNKLKNKSHNECVEHVKQISELTNRVNCLETDKEAMSHQNEQLKQELNDVAIMREKLLETEQRLQDLQKKLEAKENTAEIVPDYSKEVQLEFAKFRQADAEKRREIDKLKVELSKAQFSMCQLEQQIQRDLQLLEVRSELINSLQSNEKTNRIHMEELFAQVSEKNTTINELNGELQTKSEEFRNLFTNLSAKQVEVANQEHIIKLLEESNERSQMLRVKQEEKIGRMEEELAHLKQTIALYHSNILSGHTGKHLLYTPVLPPSNVEANENCYYYVSQRKRKRQVDINVKKYEA